MKESTKRKYERLIGTKIGFLTILEPVGPNKDRKVCVKCRCDCGNITIASYRLLKKGRTKSCGCRRRTHAIRHGMSRTPIYNCWAGIKQRCLDPNTVGYHNYGGRGIKICDRWKNSFEAFYKDVKDIYDPSLTIDRIDNEGDYEPGNVRWVTSKENCNNTRQIVHITIEGNTKTLKEWLKIYNITESTYGGRVYERKWSPEKAITTPARECEKHISINGTTKTLKEWLKIYGLNKETYNRRVYYLKWPESDDITTPAINYKKRLG